MPSHSNTHTNDIVITLDLGKLQRSFTQPVRLVVKWLGHLVSEFFRISGQFLMALLQFFSIKKMAVMVPAVMFGFGVTLFTHYQPQQVTAGQAAAETPINIIAQSINISSQQLSISLENSSDDLSAVTFFPHSQAYPLTQSLLSDDTEVAVVLGWRQQLRSEYQTLTLGDQLEVTAENNGVYSYTVIATQRSDRRNLPTALKSSNAQLIVVIPTSWLQTEFELIQARRK